MHSRGRHRTGHAAAAIACLVAVTAVPSGAQAARAGSCRSPGPQPGPTNTAEPYVQQLYGVDRLAAVATGAGVRVAVIDSGVADQHVQLSPNRVVDVGKDFMRQAPNGREDCNGHGTMVASLINAQPVDGVPFHGLAPGATVVPIRISEQTESADGTQVGDAASVRKLAQAITWAADPDGGDADVINLSLTTTSEDAELADAVKAALAAGVVIVAATGNDGTTERGNPTPYPASFDGVIGVGAVDNNNRILDFSGHGNFVDLVAPGYQLTAAAVGAGHTEFSGTSAATPLVAATAALILQRFPGSTPAQVGERLTATADPVAGGRYSPEYGHGRLNPYRAVTDTLGTDTRPAGGPIVVGADDPAAVALAARRDDARDLALLFAAIGAGVVLLIGATAVIVRRGRRRGWSPGVPG
ncbi:S8 family serine peptidase [Micromonosporaceae bacterium Da 78-11]